MPALDIVASRPRIAVIGAGISGLGAAWLLRDIAQVTLFEAEPRLGGHADTQTVSVGGTQVAVDTGFIVYNEHNYPNLTAMFRTLGVATAQSDMSFGVSIGDGALEYAGGSFPQLFAQRSNLVSLRFLAMLRDVARFYRTAPAILARADPGLTLGAYLDQQRYGEAFINDHLLPMGAAIWSASVTAMREFPASAFVRFFVNHGLLKLTNRPAWRTVTGGSRAYVAAIATGLTDGIRTGSAVTSVHRTGDGVRLRLDDGSIEAFDQIVLAVHGDIALRLLDQPTADERSVLSAVRYQDNRMVLHTDTRLMPKRRAVWSSWNYIARDTDDHGRAVSLTYWMNSLQGMKTPLPLLASLNPMTEPRDPLVIRHYRHPCFDTAMIQAQRRLPAIQGSDRLWFCGAWCGDGFHEDGLASSVVVARALGAVIPWAAGREHAAA